MLMPQCFRCLLYWPLHTEDDGQTIVCDTCGNRWPARWPVPDDDA